MNEYKYLWAQWGILNHSQYLKVMDCYGTLEIAWKNIQSDFLSTLGFSFKKIERLLYIQKNMDQHFLFKTIQDHQIKCLTIEDADYPPLLKSIHEAPPFLFLRGQIKLTHKSIGVVGTRKITEYGKKVTQNITEQLIQNGFGIVSGLAMGVDAIAHDTCVKNNAYTLGVLGSGVDQIYPKSNEKLGLSILKSGGGLISQYPIGTKPLRHHFPERNQIVSGISKGVVVTEGGVKSGALITARFALDQGREVFAIPSKIQGQPNSGTNLLIRKGEAKLIENIDHILEEFNMTPSKNSAEIPTLNKDEKQIINWITKEERTSDELVQLSQKNIQELSATLMNLQLKKVIQEVSGKWQLK